MTTLFKDDEIDECLDVQYKSIEAAQRGAMVYFELLDGDEKFLVETRREEYGELLLLEYCLMLDKTGEDGFRFSVVKMDD